VCCSRTVQRSGSTPVVTRFYLARAPPSQWVATVRLQRYCSESDINLTKAGVFPIPIFHSRLGLAEESTTTWCAVSHFADRWRPYTPASSAIRNLIRESQLESYLAFKPRYSDWIRAITCRG